MHEELLDIRRLQAFRTLAKTGSFTRTAEALFLTQSAISHSIRALEADVECELFSRVGKKVHLTLAGEVLLKRVEAVFASLTAAREAVRDLSAWGKGRLRIGASITACQYILPGVLREFKECFPDCELVIEPGDTPDTLAALRDNRVDLAITLPPLRDGAFRFRGLFQDRLSLIAAPSHKWARASRVDPAELENESFVVYNRRSYTFRMIEDYLRRDGVAIRNTIELGSMEAIKDLVKIGVGVSVLATWIVQREVAESSLRILPLGRRQLKRTWGVTMLKDRKPGLTEETFIGLCESACQGLGEQRLPAPATG
ncbi:MAG: LysR family transcriptional regulator [Opitutales bacterium]|nr:LysR family transcriptional regulator [Opitutales bacterium]